jgi:hypothetical protein
MEARQTRTRVVVSVLVLAGLLVFCLYALAGDLEPNAPPAPTMHTLDEVYNAVSSMSPSMSQREGYSKFHSCTPGGGTTILTVPAGGRFVLRKLWVRNSSDSWDISGGPNCYLHPTILHTNDGTVRDRMWDFPDACVVVESGNSLTFNNQTGGSIYTMFMGYFYDVP